jgi:hypothetical protein
MERAKQSSFLQQQLQHEIQAELGSFRESSTSQDQTPIKNE